ncbi:snRNA-activating protein complex subunit 5 [Sciurus carolinensis]|uniref:snRNA-activating protein complex subunit 5 n=1 Tax=Sciurus carolinensis TaxID=30640 RepID=A0AA41NJY0_SCICA|nr:snRNA-activating protein complex subunit 5 [Sciurus carolinensis]MBZ3891192.1 snRNA-activating protein complex subunit 5 [Sciurus carolinensis]
MLSRLQELRKEEETLLRLKAALHDQLNRLKVEELALQSIINSRKGDEMLSSSQPVAEQSHDMLVHVDNEASINQTALELSTKSHVMEEEEEEEEESDS